MPHKGTVDSLRNIVVEFLAESLHKYAKVNLSHRFIIHSPKNVSLLLWTLKLYNCIISDLCKMDQTKEKGCFRKESIKTVQRYTKQIGRLPEAVF